MKSVWSQILRICPALPSKAIRESIIIHLLTLRKYYLGKEEREMSRVVLCSYNSVPLVLWEQGHEDCA